MHVAAELSGCGPRRGAVDRLEDDMRAILHAAAVAGATPLAAAHERAQRRLAGARDGHPPRD